MKRGSAGLAATLRMSLFLLFLQSGASYGQERIDPAVALSQQRDAAEAVYSQDKVACYQQFAVNRCIAKARQKRSVVMAPLKRQEVALHDAERHTKALQQVEKQAEKSSPETLQAAQAHRLQRAEDAQKAQGKAAQNEQEKALRMSTLPATTAVRTRDYVQKEAQKIRDHSTVAAIHLDAVQKKVSFEQRQKEVAAHQADVDKTRRDRSKPLSAPLPRYGAEPTPLAARLTAP